ncbi:MAG: tetratricopeptide repeat protein [Candidatus Cloacimonetes bacterium]|nr:tetratricopeptide repeat protein [Candidatus Cloacimonadota bacterium]
MKIRIILFITSVFLCQLLWSQQATNTALLEEIRQESFDLAVLDDEVEYYQRLVDKQDQVKVFYNQNRLSNIRELFERDLAELDLIFEADDAERAVKKLWEISRVYRGIESLDIKNYFPERLLQYYQARLDVLDGKYEKARRVLEKNLAENLDPQHRNEIVQLLEEIYFNQKNYADYISVYPIYKGINTILQRWWLGQSLYSLGRIEEAATVFRRLANDDEYGLRSRCMTVLITYQNGNTAQAITDFLTLKYQYSPSTPYFNFINLCLARLYAINGNNQEAINLYDQYVQLEEDVPDEILYEIATIYKNFGEYAQAINYYKKITEKKSKSTYYVTAKYFTAITEQDRGNYESGREHLREIIVKNENLMQALNKKYALLESYSSLLHDLITETLSSERRQQIDNQLSALESQFQENRQEIEIYSEGIDSDKLLFLKLLEEEYFSYTITLANYEAFVRYSRNPMLNRLPSIQNYQMTRTDSSIVYLQMVNYIEDLSAKSAESYALAKFMAEQKVYLAFIRDIWFDINRLASDYNVAEIGVVANDADTLISRNLAIISDLEGWAFKKSLSREEKDLLADKQDQIKNNNKELEKKEKEFIDKFSQDITPQLAEKVDDFAASQDAIRNHYVDTITAMVESLSDENQMYENTLLDILFRQSRLLDQEYVEFRKQITNE